MSEVPIYDTYMYFLLKHKWKHVSQAPQLDMSQALLRHKWKPGTSGNQAQELCLVHGPRPILAHFKTPVYLKP